MAKLFAKCARYTIAVVMMLAFSFAVPAAAQITNTPPPITIPPVNSAGGTIPNPNLINTVPRTRIDPNESKNEMPKVRGDDGKFQPRDDGVKRELIRDNKVDADAGGELTRDLANVNIDQHGVCRWIDNNDETDYFIPTGSAEEWEAFVANAPSNVRIDKCCPAYNAVLRASDGQTNSTVLPVGRENSTGTFGTRRLSHTFNISGGTETVTDTFVCRNGAWTSSGQQSTQDVTEEPVVEEPDCTTTTETTPVVATWTGQWRRSSRNNTTYASSGFTNPIHQYIDLVGNTVVPTSNGSGQRSTAVFALLAPAKTTHVKVTALYDAFSGFSDGVTPKVAEFDIADGQVIIGANTPAVRVFFRSNRMGHPFIMNNNTIYMPSYDTSPNLRSLKVEYSVTTQNTVCKSNDTVVFGSQCRNSNAYGKSSQSCISNGAACLSGSSTTPNAVLPMSPTIHAGTFCSATSATDSGHDGAIVDFDLSAALEGKTGSALVLAPMNMYVGVRTQAQANRVLLGDLASIPNGFLRQDVPGGDINRIGALRLVIPDVNQDANINYLFASGREAKFGIYDNASENMVVCAEGGMTYRAATKTLSVQMGKGCRWKKNVIGTYGYGNWNQQTQYGFLNGKVWSQVRVVLPAPVDCGSEPNTCVAGTASNIRGLDCYNYDGQDYCMTSLWQCNGQRADDVKQCRYNLRIDPRTLPIDPFR